MLNAERFKEEILNIVNDDFSLAVNKNNPNGVYKCGSFPCTDCIFSKTINGRIKCARSKVNWLLAEYKEPTELIRLEHDILNYCFCGGYEYIFRDKDNELLVCDYKPNKSTSVWLAKPECSRSLKLFDNMFQFVKWEDEEATSIKDVLENCEVVENESK